MSLVSDRSIFEHYALITRIANSLEAMMDDLGSDMPSRTDVAPVFAQVGLLGDLPRLMDDFDAAWVRWMGNSPEENSHLDRSQFIAAELYAKATDGAEV